MEPLRQTIAGLALGIFGLWLLASCGSPPGVAPAPKGPEAFFTIALDGKPLALQLALTPSERQRGLRYRQSLGSDQGMLFLFPKPQKLSFWMQHTSLPLDIGYFSREGRLMEIHALFPYSLGKVSVQRDDVQMALEVNREWFSKNKIKIGACLDRAAVIAAVKARGAEPSDFGLLD